MTDSKYLGIILTAGSYNDLTKITKVYSKMEITPSIWVRLPDEFGINHQFIKMDDVQPNIKKVSNKNDKIIKEENRPWLKIFTDILDMESGYHIYKLYFLDTQIEEMSYLYFGYTIYDNNNNKTYLYMNRNGVQE